MRKAAVLFTLSVICAWCLTASAWGGGLEISGVGAKAKAMGGAFRAVADDWSAAYYNPAGLFYTTEDQLTFDEVFTNYQYSYTPDVTYDGYGVGFYDGKIYNRYKVLTNPTLGGFFKFPVAGRKVAAGFAVFQPFDKNLSWQVFSPLNNAASLPGQQIQHNFDAVAVNVMGAIELKENLLSFGISAGVLKNDLVYGGFFLRPNPADPSALFYDQVASRPNELITEWQNSDGKGYAPNLRAGFLLKPTPRLNIGLSYAIQTKATVKGSSYFYYYMPDNPAYHTRPEVMTYPDSINFILSSGAIYKADADFKTDVTLPAQLAGGLAYQLNDKTLVAADVEYTFWSQFDGYKFHYTFADANITTNGPMNTWMTQDLAVPVDWKNSLKAAVGIQYAYRDGVLVRCGYSADQSPVKDGTQSPAFFDPGLAHSFNLGLGLVFENVIIDLATEYRLYPEATENGNMDITGDGIAADMIVDNMPGVYKGSAFESIIQFTVRF